MNIQTFFLSIQFLRIWPPIHYHFNIFHNNLTEAQYLNNFDSLLSFLPENITLFQKREKKIKNEIL